MKKLSIIVLATIIITVVLSAQGKMDKKELRNKSHSMIGYLVDQSCGKRMVMDDVKKSDAKAARHTKDCALDEVCSAKGYGLVAGGKFYTFDDAGNKKAAKYLNATKKENHFKVEVAGMMDGDKMKVESIKDFKPIGKKK
ncbi:MAG: hypothetical protein NTX44_05685 [Ignavibacteriales bacterium]|nr:hypothetical protein [Ignavibacteriales bacterium]